jgi:membrane protease YdiL (CAAX protease family)
VLDRRKARAKAIAIGEILLVALVFVLDAKGLIPFSKTPVLLVLAWISLRARKTAWRDVGLVRYRTWAKTIALGVGVGLSLEAFQLFVSQPLLVAFFDKQPDLEVFRSLEGRLGNTLVYLVLVWALAAFGEEMVYRGYLMNRVADMFDRTKAGWIASLILVHVGFGLAHAYQGITGIVDEGLMGLILGVVYLACGRNLLVPIIAHGIQDSIDLVLIFLGRYPGM